MHAEISSAAAAARDGSLKTIGCSLVTFRCYALMLRDGGIHWVLGRVVPGVRFCAVFAPPWRANAPALVALASLAARAVAERFSGGLARVAGRAEWIAPLAQRAREPVFSAVFSASSRRDILQVCALIHGARPLVFCSFCGTLAAL